MIVSRAPLRISFAGGGSDLASYSRRNGGAVLSTSISKYVYVTVNKKFDKDVRVSYSITENESRSRYIKHPIVRNALEFFDIDGGIEITSISDIPSQGSGLGSSSAFTVALIHALSEYQGRSITPEELGAIASYIEIEMCGDVIGKQDQYASAAGGLNFIKFNKDDSVSLERIVCGSRTIKECQNSIVAFYTGRSRSASQLLTVQSENMKRKDKAAIVSKMVSIAYDMKAAFEKDDISSLGELLDQSWKLKRSVASGISDLQIDDWYSRGMRAGASGGKILGAGNGGFLMFIVAQENKEKVITALNELRHVSFEFEKCGSTILFAD